MRVADEATWELNTPEGVAIYWDDIIDEFGPEGYVEMRYTSQIVHDDTPEGRTEWTTAEAGQQEQHDRNAA